MDKIVRVVVVDDSAYMRKILKEMLSRSPYLEVVGTARDGADALDVVEQLRPDVVTLDLMMPNMDGLTFLRHQMARRPIPVVVVSITSQNGEMVLGALEAGAIDMVQKPTALASERVFEISDDLIAKVKSAATARLVRLPDPLVQPYAKPKSSPPNTGSIDLVAIGVSTGGPQALKYLLPQLPANLPVPVAVVIHMPVGYTEHFASNLNEISPLNVSEAKDGAVLKPGTILLAPAGRHLTFRRLGDGSVAAQLGLQPADSGHRPSVDELFRSAAEVFGSRTLGIVMTGMGSDGTKGAAWIKAQGGMIITEAEETCVVYGMPRSVVEAGLSDRSLPLNMIGQAILEAV
jgi:two-component system, chemotaxis family, protein-glutamate methylesterase/glutaminase